MNNAGCGTFVRDLDMNPNAHPDTQSGGDRDQCSMTIEDDRFGFTCHLVRKRREPQLGLSAVHARFLAAHETSAWMTRAKRYTFGGSRNIESVRTWNPFSMGKS